MYRRIFETDASKTKGWIKRYFRGGLRLVKATGTHGLAYHANPGFLPHCDDVKFVIGDHERVALEQVGTLTRRSIGLHSSHWQFLPTVLKLLN